MRTLISDVISRSLTARRMPPLHIREDDARILCNLGLGPTASHLVTNGSANAVPATTELLRGADLTARVLYQQTAQGVARLLTALHENHIQSTLLKGISIADQYYEPTWSRLMGDVDILVPQDDIEKAAEVLVRLGYEPDANERLEGEHHHIPAMRHLESGVIVELHTGLFPPETVPANLPVFSNSVLEQQSRDAEFAGIPIRRFTEELQFAYTIAHWAIERKWPFSVFPVFDAAHLCREPGFDWSLLDDWIQESDWLAVSACQMLSVLRDGQMAKVPDSMVTRIDSTTAKFGKTAYRLMNRLIWAIPMRGRTRALVILDQNAARTAWRTLLTPDDPGNLRATLSALVQAQLKPLIAAIRRTLRKVLRRQTINSQS